MSNGNEKGSSSSTSELPPMNAAVWGGGDFCGRILRWSQDGNGPLRILGVSDNDPEAAVLVLAKELGRFTSTSHRDLYSIQGLELIIDLAGRGEITDDLRKACPPGVTILSERAAKSFLVPLMTAASSPPPPKNREDIQTILDSLPYRVMVVNIDMTIYMVNQTFLREKGLTYRDVIGKFCYEVRYNLTSPCGACDMPCYLEEVKEHGKTLSKIHEFTGENGETRFEVITVSPILDDKGQIVQLVEASRDVTDRIRLEREVQKSNMFLQNVIQSTVDGIVVVDTKGYVLLFNEGMERLTGYSSSEIKEKGHISKFYNMAVARENMRKMRSDQHGPVGKLNPTSMVIVSKTGEEIPITLSASIITINGKEVGSVGVFTDMREVLKMRKDLEEAHFQLVQSEKIASIGRMAAGVAHEINNPLSGILIYAELLKPTLGAPQQSADIQEIIDQTLRCKRIVSELLEFSRESIGKTSSFNLDSLLSKCLSLLVHQASFQNIQIIRSIEPGMPEMVGDMGQLQQVFTNLFINATDAMEGRGTLTIGASFDPETDRFKISVADTGPGIPLRLRDKVFDMFFTTKPMGRGTGLGLSISQNIVKLHGGNISFTCPAEGGTIFLIELPLEYSEAAENQPVFYGLGEP